MAYLDDTGLAYFWGRLKAWAQGMFALIGHTHSSSDVAAMTGYSIPASTGAISSGDTLNQAVGKLEKAIDAADISNVVHTSGDETVAGIKTFTDSIIFERSYPIIQINNTGYNVSGYGLSDIRFIENNVITACIRSYANDSVSIGRKSDNYSSWYNGSQLILYKDGSWSLRTDGDTSATIKTLSCDFAGALTFDGPEPAANDDSTKLATTQWVNDASTVVHTSGDESIFGAKHFMSADNLFLARILLSSSTIVMLELFCTGTSGTMYQDIRFMNGNTADGTVGAVIRHYVNSSLTIGNSKGSGSTWSTGCYIDLLTNGKFNIVARIDSTKRILEGSYNGSLTWNGQTIQTTSDARLKTKLSAVPESVLDCWEGVEWGQFRFLDAVAEKGASARLHVGLIAQQVSDAFAGGGLDACAYGILCHEVQDASPEVLDENGAVAEQAKDAVDLWMARYTEALCMEAAYMRRENARLKKRVSDLEERLAALELKVS